MAKKDEDASVISFASKQYKQSLQSYKQVLDQFRLGEPQALALEGDCPIFLDTNVLLSVYEVSFIAREKVKQFVEKYKARIVLTSQVQKEFIKNREKVINTFQSTVTEQIPKNFKSEVLNRFISFKNSNKSKLEDYAEVQEKLNALEEKIIELNKNIEEKVNDKKDIDKVLVLEDDFLNLLSTLKVSDELKDDFLTTLKQDYDKLLPAYQSTIKLKKDDSETTSIKETFSLTVFPGCGEKGDKDDPYGDFIIYHELMLYALSQKQDVIFLTNDTTKGDWLRKDGKVHIHYLENFYNNTGQLIYIINAERLFETLFVDTSFESLIPKAITNKIELTTESLKNFLENYEPFTFLKYKDVTIKEEYFTEITTNGYYFIGDIKNTLDDVKVIISQIMKMLPDLNKVGLMRACLAVFDEKYVHVNPDGGLSADNSKFDSIRDQWRFIRDL